MMNEALRHTSKESHCASDISHSQCEHTDGSQSQCERSSVRNNTRTSYKSTEKLTRQQKETLARFKVFGNLRRRSQFSCHDKALRKAGYDMAEFDPIQKELREKLRRERERRQSMRPQCDVTEDGRPDPTVFAAAADAAAAFVAKQKRRLSTLDTAKYGTHADPMQEAAVHADPRRMIEYLYLVREFPDEYHLLQRAFNNSHKKPVEDLVGRSALFSRYRDKVAESVAQTAAYELSTRHAHPVCARFEEIEREKERAMQKGTLKSIRTAGLSNKELKQIEQELYGKGVVVNDDLTPLERARAEVEFWMRDKSMAQIIQARELALKVLEEEDV